MCFFLFFRLNRLNPLASSAPQLTSSSPSRSSSTAPGSQGSNPAPGNQFSNPYSNPPPESHFSGGFPGPEGDSRGFRGPDTGFRDHFEAGGFRAQQMAPQFSPFQQLNRSSGSPQSSRGSRQQTRQGRIIRDKNTTKKRIFLIM